MLRELKNSPRVAGAKQLRKAINRGEVNRVFLAQDADPDVTESIEALAAARSIPITRVSTMAELGQSCGIAVGASAAGLLTP